MKIKKNKNKELSHSKWVILITIAAFFLSILMNFFAEQLLTKANVIISFVILIGIIVIGIVFDAIGVAVTVGEEKPFHSMAAAKVKGAKHALVLIRNASKVSSFCNDVVGDICGIISGASAAFIIAKIASTYPDTNMVIFSAILSGFVASLTIGGKAVGKEIAMKLSKDIIMLVANGLSVFSK